MKIQNRRIRFLLILTLVLLPSWFIFSGTGNALGSSSGETWELTADAVARTAAGDCPVGKVCREFCYLGQPQGDFLCFND